ncbi:Uncharacterised protein [Mycobacteroides abscessus subsp. abscessus]|nr:Uncharacterised protein [Mycobacteroides abscessus subsp. abscessus]
MNRNTAGRGERALCAPLTRTRTPRVASVARVPRAISPSAIARRRRVGALTSTPADAPPSNAANPATVRA